MIHPRVPPSILPYINTIKIYQFKNVLLTTRDQTHVSCVYCREQCGISNRYCAVPQRKPTIGPIRSNSSQIQLMPWRFFFGRQVMENESLHYICHNKVCVVNRLRNFPPFGGNSKTLQRVFFDLFSYLWKITTLGLGAWPKIGYGNLEDSIDHMEQIRIQKCAVHMRNTTSSG